MLIDKHLKYSIEDVNDEREEQDDPHAMRQTASEAIEKSISDDLEFEYYVGPWSSCSQTCGLNDSGYRVSKALLWSKKKWEEKKISILVWLAGGKSTHFFCLIMTINHLIYVSLSFDPFTAWWE